MAIIPSLDREIQKKADLVAENPEYYMKRYNMVHRRLNHVKNAYSFWIEHPDLRQKLLDAPSDAERKKIKKFAREGVKQLREAWNHLAAFQKDGEFIKYITPELIKDVGELVDPAGNKYGFRTINLGGLNMRNYVPPNCIKIPDLLEQFCTNIKHSDYSPVEAAAYAHLHIASIQPFPDGNKRTSRLIQDHILDAARLPPAMIPAGEKDVYFDLLEQGFAGIRDNNLRAQRPFFDYIGGKVNTALDEILGDLHVRIR